VRGRGAGQRSAAGKANAPRALDESPRTARLRISGASAEIEAGAEADAGLEVAGRLAAELGHDLNNQLSAVLSYSFLLGRAVDRDPALKEHLAELQASAWRAADLAQTLRHFAPRRASQRGPLDVNAIILAAAPVLRRVLDECSLETRLALRLPAGTGARTELEQVLVGLVLHARRTLPRGGTIVLTTRGVGAEGDPERALVRISCTAREADDDSLPARAPAAVSRPAPRLSLVRRALKRLGARLSHDAEAVHVDLPGRVD
jgi:signal transduction histidine kinase